MENTSGLFPVEYKVLLKPDEVEEKTAGGIVIPKQAKEKEERESIFATLVECGGNTFADPMWGDPVPAIGDRVCLSKYAGENVIGADGKKYKICNDKDIAAIVKKEIKQELSPTDQPDNAGDGVYESVRSK